MISDIHYFPKQSNVFYEQGQYFYFHEDQFGELGDLFDSIHPIIPQKYQSTTYYPALSKLLFSLMQASFIAEDKKKPCQVIISRRAGDYKKPPKHSGLNPSSYYATMGVIQALFEAGLIEQTMGWFEMKTNSGKRSTLTPTPLFQSLLKQVLQGLDVADYCGRGRVILRDENKKLVDFCPNEEVFRMRGVLMTINDCNREHCFTVNGGQQLPDYYFSFNRVFNRDFDHGGRLYCLAQSLPSRIRKTMRIDGEETVELDFSGLHPTMVYHLEGLTAMEKPYLVDGITEENRPAAKKALLILFNCKDKTSALKALNQALTSEITLTGLTVKELVSLLEKAHRPVAHYFFTGFGLRTMNLDAQIAERVMVEFAKKGKPILGIHDSFLVKKRDEEYLWTLMEDSYRTVMQRVVPAEKGYSGAVPGISNK